MKIKIFALSVLLLYIPLLANAIITQKILLKNGSELEGYISQQRPGNSFTFTTERAVIYMSGKGIIPSDYEIKIKDLSPAWIEWAEKNDAFIGLGDNRVLVLSDINAQGKTISRVRILEKGAKIKYLEIGNNSYNLNWDTIAVVKGETRSKTALTGINRIYKLENGQEYEGQYAEEVPGKTLSLLCDNGVVEVFETNKVIKYSMRKINANQTLLEQCQLLDIVQLKNNKGFLKGIIIEQNFSNKTPSENYLLLQTENGATQSIKLADIEEYRKEVNPNYKPLFDILLSKGELVVNRKQTNSLRIKEAGNFIMLQGDTCLAIIEQQNTPTKVIIETRFDNDEQNQTLKIVKVNRYPLDKKKKLFDYGFTYEDIVKSNIHPLSVQTSINQTTKFEYAIYEKGLYAIYSAKDKTVIPFRIN